MNGRIKGVRGPVDLPEGDIERPVLAVAIYPGSPADGWISLSGERQNMACSTATGTGEEEPSNSYRKPALGMGTRRW